MNTAHALVTLAMGILWGWFASELWGDHNVSFMLNLFVGIAGASAGILLAWILGQELGVFHAGVFAFISAGIPLLALHFWLNVRSRE